MASNHEQDFGNSGATTTSAVVVHIYHYDVWLGIAQRLMQLEAKFDLYITISPERAEEHLGQIRKQFPNARIRIHKNIGMDIVPFLGIVTELYEAGYTSVLKLHTKKGKSGHGEPWSETMVESLVGNNETFLQVQKNFDLDSDMKLAGPAEMYLRGPELILGNAPKKEVLQKYLFPNTEEPNNWGFFAGTMFWSRPDLWLSLSNWARNNMTLFEDDYALDGLWVHAIERVFGLIVCCSSGRLGLLHVQEAGSGRHLQVSSVASAHVSSGTSEKLVAQILAYEEDARLLRECKLLDTDAYKQHLESRDWRTSDIEAVDLVWHFLTIGQFEKGRGCSLAWELRARNRGIHWRGFVRQPRRPGVTSIIIPVYGQIDLLKKCVDSVIKNTPRDTYEIILVDNGNSEQESDAIERLSSGLSNVRVTKFSTNMNFAFGCNHGFTKAKGEYCLFLNSDTEVSRGWLEPMVRVLRSNDAFAVQPLLTYEDGRTQSGGVVFSSRSELGYPLYSGLMPGVDFSERTREVEAVTGACMALRSSEFAAVQGFDPIYINGQEDVDLCFRLKDFTGKHAYAVHESKVVHHESQSRGRGRYVTQNRRVFLARWQGVETAQAEDIYAEDGMAVVGWSLEESSRNWELRTASPLLVKAAGESEHQAGSGGPLEAHALERANRAFREGRYATAEHLYKRVRAERREMRRTVKPNIELTHKRMSESLVPHGHVSYKRWAPQDRAVKLCAIAKNEGPYLPRWIYHHITYGFKGIEVWLNRIEDNSLEIMEKISSYYPEVEYRLVSPEHLPGGRNSGFQEVAYRDMYERARTQGYSHVLFLDLDEMWVPQDFTTAIPDFLGALPHADSVSFQWLLDAPDTDAGTFRSPLALSNKLFPHRHVKSAIATKKDVDTFRIHNAVIPEGKYILADGSDFLSNGSSDRSELQILPREYFEASSQKMPDAFILHSVHRSQVEYLASLSRGRPLRGDRNAAPIKDNRWGYVREPSSGSPLDFNLDSVVLAKYELGFERMLNKIGLHTALTRSRAMLLDRTEQLLSRIKTQPEMFHSAAHVFKGLNLDSINEFRDEMGASIEGHIDNVQLDSERLSIDGWAFVTDYEGLPSFSLLVGGQELEPLGLETFSRADVVDAVDPKAPEHCGFRIRFAFTGFNELKIGRAVLRLQSSRGPDKSLLLEDYVG